MQEIFKLKTKEWQNILFESQKFIIADITTDEAEKLMLHPVLLADGDNKKYILRYVTYAKELSSKQTIISLTSPSDFQPMFPETRELADFGKLSKLGDTLWSEGGNVFTNTQDGFLAKGIWSVGSDSISDVKHD